MGYYTPVTLRFDFAGDTFVGDTPLVFQNPVGVVRACTLEEVVPALEAVQQASERGLYAAGYVAYEAAPAFDGALETHLPSGAPLVWFGLFSAPTVPAESDPPASAAALSGWALDTNEATYRAAVDTIRANIAGGVTYQTNYTVRLTTPETPPDPYGLYHALRQRHRPPYASFLDTGERQIVSLSPELFFRTEGRHITTRPMKGTSPRGRFLEEDDTLAAALRESPKERAENVMIVDLLRNDLGRVAVPGSVAVPELLTLETYPTFHTLTSAVTAALPASVKLPELFRALFPCGSVTGAPKVSTMKLIRRLEPTPRGIYCGAIGYLKPGGDAVFSVPIRTLEVALHPTRRGATYGVGSGVTWDSRGETEYAELAVKAALVTATWPAFDLLETLLWDGRELVRLEGHVARAAASARFFGFALEQGELAAQLLAHAQTFPGSLRRVRALVAQSGSVRVESQPFVPSSTPLTVALALDPIDSRNTFLFHKTTHRSVYEDCLRNTPPTPGTPLDDVLLYNERGELTEFTVGNLVLELGDRLLTPPRDAGLLAGVLRAEALASGQLSEQTLYPSDLARATRIWRINSLRGWQAVDSATLKGLEFSEATVGRVN